MNSDKIVLYGMGSHAKELLLHEFYMKELCQVLGI